MRYRGASHGCIRHDSILVALHDLETEVNYKFMQIDCAGLIVILGRLCKQQKGKPSATVLAAYRCIVGMVQLCDASIVSLWCL